MSFYPLTGLFWPLASIVAVLTQTSYGVGGVCLNSYLPFLAKRSAKRVKYGLDNNYTPIITHEPEEGEDVDDNASFSHSECSSSSGDADVESEGGSVDNHSVQTHTAKLSAYGQAIGYASGIALLIVLLIPLNILSKTPHPPNNPVPPPVLVIGARKLFSERSPVVAIRACVSLTGVLWASLSVPAITLIRQDTPATEGRLGENTLTYKEAIKAAWKRLYQTFQVAEIKQLQSTYWFLLAWASLSDGERLSFAGFSRDLTLCRICYYYINSHFICEDTAAHAEPAAARYNGVVTTSWCAGVDVVTLSAEATGMVEPPLTCSARLSWSLGPSLRSPWVSSTRSTSSVRRVYHSS